MKRGKRTFIGRFKHPHGTPHTINSIRVRSTLEATLLEQLLEAEASFIYEGAGIAYITKHTYTPDFVLKTKRKENIYIEAKGWFIPQDRTKMIAVKKQHPKADIRFVFQSPHSPIYTGSKTTYAMWADKWKFPWADSHIPQEWIDE
jgi:hypothetical protein